MSTLFPDSDDDGHQELAIIHKRATPREGNATPQDVARWRKFKFSMSDFWHRYIRGYAWGQVDRLREAKLREIESHAEERSANARAKLAEARKTDAEAMLIFAEIEKKRSVVSREMSLEEAFTNLEAAVQVIKMRGGNVEIRALEITKDI